MKGSTSARTRREAAHRREERSICNQKHLVPTEVVALRSTKRNDAMRRVMERAFNASSVFFQQL